MKGLGDVTLVVNSQEADKALGSPLSFVKGTTLYGESLLPRQHMYGS